MKKKSKMDNRQGPTVQPREFCSMLCGSLDGRGVWGRMDTCYVWLSPFAFFFSQKDFLGIRRGPEFQASGLSFRNSGPSIQPSLQGSPCQLSTSS